MQASGVSDELMQAVFEALDREADESDQGRHLELLACMRTTLEAWEERCNQYRPSC